MTMNTDKLMEMVAELRGFADEARASYAGEHASGTFRAVVKMLDDLAAVLRAEQAVGDEQRARGFVAVPVGPKECPITGLPFFANVEHPKLGLVATYGGPFDSYTIPAYDEQDAELRHERYDWDADHWVEGGEPVGYLCGEQRGELATHPCPYVVASREGTHYCRLNGPPSQQAEGMVPVGEVRWAAGIVGSIAEVNFFDGIVPQVGTVLFAAAPGGEGEG